MFSCKLCDREIREFDAHECGDCKRSPLCDLCVTECMDCQDLICDECGQDHHTKCEGNPLDHIGRRHV